jgi:ribosome biogenesis GTPase
MTPEALTPAAPNLLLHGTVIKSTGSWYIVRGLETGQLYRCRLRGKFKIKGLKASNPLAVGDHVEFTVEAQGEGAAVISHIVPRRNYIVRKSVHKTGHVHIVAANLDQALLVVTLVSPATSFGFIDRFLVTAEAYHIPVTLLFNKTDLYDADGFEYQAEIAGMYASLGYPSRTCAATTGEGVAEIDQLLDGQVSLLAGHSGVGKSTLINALVPDLDLKTASFPTKACTPPPSPKCWTYAPAPSSLIPPASKNWASWICRPPSWPATSPKCAPCSISAATTTASTPTSPAAPYARLLTRAALPCPATTAT